MAKPKLALIPASQGTKLYSVLPANGVGDFAFTRDTIATRINSQGLIETVASGVSRLNYPLIDGVVNGCPSLLLEPLKINNLQRSEEFENAYWVNNGVTITANQTISPSGQLNADLLNGVSGGFGIVRFSTWTETNKVASCFAKAGATNIFKIANVSASNRYVLFDLSNGTVFEQSSGWTGFIENYGNGWYRCTAISNNETGTFSLSVTAASESVYIWGVQLESDYKTSYIPTTTSAVTRSSETAIGSGDNTIFNGSQGVLMAEISTLNNSGTKSISITDGTATNIITVRYLDSLIQGLYVNSANSTTYIINYTLPNVKDFTKVALSYQSGSLKLYVNGTLIQNIALVVNDIPDWNTLKFDIGNGSQVFYGNAKQVQYFDEVLTDAELIKLTTI